ncbi:hypothetical protein FRC18_009409 [Serendipita sp. 400]|nr:hypothetical protein FRC18_009409 [Serendipita sp. 400]
MEDRILDLATKLQEAKNPTSKLLCLREISTLCAHLEREMGDNGKSDKAREGDSRNLTRVYSPEAAIPINSLPTEILLYVFEHHISMTSIRRNAILMMVCKGWRTLIYTSPMLWNLISIKPMSCSIPSLAGWRRLAEVCIKRSGDVLLDISLDFGEMPSVEKELLEATLDFFSDHKERFSVPRAPLSLMRSAATGRLQSQFNEIFRVLIGGVEVEEDEEEGEEEGEEGDEGRKCDIPQFHIQRTPVHMNRWRRFTLILPVWMKDPFTTSIFHRLCHATPSLERLEFFKTGSRQGRIEFNGNEFPFLNGIKDLETNFQVNLARFLPQSHSLETLYIPFLPTSFYNLTHYSKLLILTITAKGAIDGEYEDELPARRIDLPSLTSLRLDGSPRFWGVLATSITAPNLRHLRLSGPCLEWLPYPTSQLFATVQSLDLDFYLGLFLTDECKCYLEILGECRQLQKLSIRNHNDRTSDTRGTVEAALPLYHLAHLETVTYLDSSSSLAFDDTPIEQIVQIACPPGQI